MKVDFEPILNEECFKCENNCIRPKDIDLSNSLSDCFGKRETENNACVLVEFFQMMGKWEVFSLSRLFDYMMKVHSVKATQTFEKIFYGLLGPWYDDQGVCSGTWRMSPNYIVQISPGKFAITDLFIKRILKHVKKFDHP